MTHHSEVRVQSCCTFTETIRIIRDGEPGRPPRLSHSAVAQCVPAPWTYMLIHVYIKCMASSVLPSGCVQRVCYRTDDDDNVLGCRADISGTDCKMLSHGHSFRDMELSTVSQPSHGYAHCQCHVALIRRCPILPNRWYRNKPPKTSTYPPPSSKMITVDTIGTACIN